MFVAFFAPGFLISVMVFWPAHTEGFPKRPGGGCIPCHTGPFVDDMVSAIGIPEFYSPNQSYPLNIVMTDSNGPATGDNSFDFVVSLGTLSSTDPNVRVLYETEAVAWGDTTVASWTVTWTAPASECVNITLWGVVGDGQNGKADPWDAEYYLSSPDTVPEFSSVAIPGLAVAVGVLAFRRYVGR